MRAWIGYDLDASLAEYSGWQGPDHIGKPIQKSVDRINKWLANGEQVKIFTARASDPYQVKVVQKWIREVFGRDLEVTNVKDFGMISLYDDRAVQLIPNTGERVDGKE